MRAAERTVALALAVLAAALAPAGPAASAETEEGGSIVVRTGENFTAAADQVVRVVGLPAEVVSLTLTMRFPCADCYLQVNPAAAGPRQYDAPAGMTLLRYVAVALHDNAGGSLRDVVRDALMDVRVGRADVGGASAGQVAGLFLGDGGWTPAATRVVSAFTDLRDYAIVRIAMPGLTVYESSGGDGPPSATGLVAVTVDTTPPSILDVAPPPGTRVVRSASVRATFSDARGVDGGTVLLEVDGANVTSRAALTSDSIAYAPPDPFAPGVHAAKVSLRDASGLATERAWSFEVVERLDDRAPAFLAREPADGAWIRSVRPLVRADYADDAGVRPDLVRVLLDGRDVTAGARITATRLEYETPEDLAEGEHRVAVDAGDAEGNVATASWTFLLDATPPVVRLLEPSDGAVLGAEPFKVRAEFEDALAGIDLAMVVLRVDAPTVTSHAVVTDRGLAYAAPAPLPYGEHSVRLTVTDRAGNPATEKASFTVQGSGVAAWSGSWYAWALAGLLFVGVAVAALAAGMPSRRRRWR